MVSAEQFLTDFVKDIVLFPASRKELIAGYAAHMKAREQMIAKQGSLRRGK